MTHRRRSREAVTRRLEAPALPPGTDSVLMRASALVTDSPDPTRAMAQFAALVIPTFADACFVDVLTPAGSWQALLVRHPGDPVLAPDAEVAPPVLRRPETVTQPEFRTPVTDEWLEARVQSPELLDSLRGGRVHSAVLTPLVLEDTTYGILGLFGTDPDRPPFGPAEVEQARALASLAAGALRTGRTVAALEEKLRERERVEHELRASVRREARRAAEFSAIMDAVPTGVFLAYDRDCRVIKGNSWAYRLIRAERHGNASMSVPDAERVIHATIRQDGTVLGPDQLPMQRAAKSGEVTRGAEHEYLFPDGSRAFMMTSCVPLLDERGEPRGAVAAMLDVTRMKETEQELLAHRERLEHLVEERTEALRASLARLAEVERIATIGTLAAGLGHDLSNLLMPLRLRLESLAAQDLPRAARADVRALSKTEEYLRRLARALRLLAASPDPARERGASTGLPEWWHDVRTLFRDAIPRGVVLTGRIPTGVPAVAMSAAGLTQAVLNLVQNAGRAAEGGESPRVVVWAEHDPARDRVRIGVSDNGCGLPPEVMKQCFEPFFTTQKREFSTGLGLAVVRALVHRAGGEVTCESEPGHGATFVLAVPIHESPSGAGESPGARRSALVTVGDPRKRALVRGLLERNGITAQEDGADGAAASVIWVTDAATPVEELGNFVRQDPARLAIVLDAPAALPASRQIRAVASRDVAFLRTLLTGATAEALAR